MLIKLVFIVSIRILAGAASDQDKNKTLEELEKEKNELYNQINKAIDESVKSLQKANDSDSFIGLQYMKDLKERMKKVNETVVKIEEGIEDPKSDLENRRRYKNVFDPSIFEGKKFTVRDIFDFEKVLRPKNASASKWRGILENRQKMQKQLDKWILEREKEKERLDRYKLSKKRLIMSGKYEKCPRYGYKGNKKKEKKNKYRLDCKDDENYEKCKNLTQIFKNNAMSNNDAKRIRSSSSNKKKYPCCRKCCKKSYLGCL